MHIFLVGFPRKYLQCCALFIPAKVGVPVFLDPSESRRKRNDKVFLCFAIFYKVLHEAER